MRAGTPIQRATLGRRFNVLAVPTLAVWLDALDITTLYQDSAATTPVATDADPVGYWGDKSGNARHVTQATGAARPTYKVSIRNGLPVIRFDGTDDYLRASFTTISQPLSFFYVATMTSLYSTPLDSVTSGAGTGCAIYRDTVNFAFFAGSTISDGAVDSNWHAWGAIGNNTLSSINKNGTVTAGTAGTQGLAGGITVGSNRTLSGAFLNGDIAEMIIASSALDAGWQSAIMGYLKNKWGTP